MSTCTNGVIMADYSAGYPRLTTQTHISSSEFSHGWFKDNAQLTDRRFVITERIMDANGLHSFTLKIQPFRLQDAGLYVFKIYNNGNDLKEEVFFEIDEARIAELLVKQNRRSETALSGTELKGRSNNSRTNDYMSSFSDYGRSDTAPEQRLSSNHLMATKKVATCSPSTLPATQQVAPQVAAVECHPDPHDNTEFLSVFECPVCLEYMLPPYLQCNSGHLVCGNCRPKLQCCPTCRGSIPNVRNLGLEKIANTIRFPCKFASSGCLLVFYHQEKVEHEESCEFRPYGCPCPGASCKWQGALTEVMDHLKKIHKSITTLQGEDIVFLATDINLPGAVDWVMMQSCFGYNFMLVLEKQDRDQGQQMFYAVVQLIGAKKEAELFMYRLELSTMRRRLAWEATPRSIHEGVAQAIQQSDCLAFDTSTAQLFAENGNLGINVTISMASGDPVMLSSNR